ncbi:tetrahydrofolate dehydrogenase/cyclohydrolase, NAD(P)-binding domain-containing protein [Besnoitia besnoiti]|uniref:methenyltetrahydrofolate cyclohydrolase n=1 Tax=Besnoitia besnoiti TaxID=94643 RepID=A0A2A9MC21_BESBE|nr:tetrahydrofolate dehydrogenase/cyclohydrolase, NAD(P)-binding domain-containing protein [Besnoitia besnoiti]PFH33476.1 tetrahydrofolate dehydrogenase/cyclohydrolase, NAD(P)-binding domain-containing protein [Besnoitia besnoiti]
MADTQGGGSQPAVRTASDEGAEAQREEKRIPSCREIAAHILEVVRTSVEALQRLEPPSGSRLPSSKMPPLRLLASWPADAPPPPSPRVAAPPARSSSTPSSAPTQAASSASPTAAAGGSSSDPFSGAFEVSSPAPGPRARSGALSPPQASSLRNAASGRRCGAVSRRPEEAVNAAEPPHGREPSAWRMQASASRQGEAAQEEGRVGGDDECSSAADVGIHTSAEGVERRRRRDGMDAFFERLSAPPHLVAVSVGMAAAGASFLKRQRQAAEACGVSLSLLEFPVPLTELTERLREQSASSSVDGIVLLSPVLRLDPTASSACSSGAASASPSISSPSLSLSSPSSAPPSCSPASCVSAAADGLGEPPESALVKASDTFLVHVLQALVAEKDVDGTLPANYGAMAACGKYAGQRQRAAKRREGGDGEAGAGEGASKRRPLGVREGGCAREQAGTVAEGAREATATALAGGERVTPPCAQEKTRARGLESEQPPEGGSTRELAKKASEVASEEGAAARTVRHNSTVSGGAWACGDACGAQDGDVARGEREERQAEERRELRHQLKRILRNLEGKDGDDGGDAPEEGEECLDTPFFAPCVAVATIEILKAWGVPLAGALVSVVGTSANVGQACALLLLQCQATVVACNSRTRNLEALLKASDVIVAAAGSPHLISAAMVKEGAAVIDVGVSVLAPRSSAGSAATGAEAARPAQGSLQDDAGSSSRRGASQDARGSIASAEARGGPGGRGKERWTSPRVLGDVDFHQIGEREDEARPADEAADAEKRGENDAEEGQEAGVQRRRAEEAEGGCARRVIADSARAHTEEEKRREQAPEKVATINQVGRRRRAAPLATRDHIKN